MQATLGFGHGWRLAPLIVPTDPKAAGPRQVCLLPFRFRFY
jgi:hypothetical protein